MLPSNPINIYINKINNRLTFKIKDWYKLELQTPETMKLFGSTKILIDRTKNGEDESIDKSLDVSYSFMSNKSYAYLLNINLTRRQKLIRYYYKNRTRCSTAT